MTGCQECASACADTSLMRTARHDHSDFIETKDQPWRSGCPCETHTPLGTNEVATFVSIRICNEERVSTWPLHTLAGKELFPL